MKKGKVNKNSVVIPGNVRQLQHASRAVGHVYDLNAVFIEKNCAWATDGHALAVAENKNIPAQALRFLKVGTSESKDQEYSKAGNMLVAPDGSAAKVASIPKRPNFKEAIPTYKDSRIVHFDILTLNKLVKALTKNRLRESTFVSFEIGGPFEPIAVSVSTRTKRPPVAGLLMTCRSDSDESPLKKLKRITGVK